MAIAEWEQELWRKLAGPRAHQRPAHRFELMLLTLSAYRELRPGQTPPWKKLSEVLNTFLAIEDHMPPEDAPAAGLGKLGSHVSLGLAPGIALDSCFRTFRTSCSEANLLTPSALRWGLAKALRATPNDGLSASLLPAEDVEVHAGLSLPPSRLAWLNALACHRRVRIWVDRSDSSWGKAGEALLHHLENRGAELRLELIPRSLDSGIAATGSCYDVPQQEESGLIAELQQALATGNSPHELAVCVTPNERRRVANLLEDHGLGTSKKPPIAPRHNPGLRWLLDWVRVGLAGWPKHTTLRLAEQFPWCNEAQGLGDLRRRLYSAPLMHLGPAALASLEQSLGTSQALAQLRELHALATGITVRTPLPDATEDLPLARLSECFAHYRKLAHAGGQASPEPTSLDVWLGNSDTAAARAEARGYSSARETRETLQNAIELLRGCALEDFGIPRALTPAVMEQVLQESRHGQSQHSGGGIEVMTLPEIEGRTFDSVWVVGSQEGCLPAYHPPNLLDEELRQQLGDWRRDEELALWTLGLPFFAARKALRFTWSAKDRQGLEQRRCAHLDALVASGDLRVVEAPPASQGLWSMPEKTLAAIAGHRAEDTPRRERQHTHRAVRIARPLPLGVDGAAHHRLRPAVLRVGPTALETMAACPYQHFAGYELRLRSPTFAELTPGALDRGKIAHKAFETAIETLKRQGMGRWRADLAEPARQCAAQSSAAAALRCLIEAGAEPELAQWEAESLGSDIGELIAALMQQDDGFSPYATEQKFGGGDRRWPALRVQLSPDAAAPEGAAEAHAAKMQQTAPSAAKPASTSPASSESASPHLGSARVEQTTTEAATTAAVLEITGRIDLVEERGSELRLGDLKSAGITSLLQRFSPQAWGEQHLQLALYGAAVIQHRLCRNREAASRQQPPPMPEARYLSLGHRRATPGFWELRDRPRSAWRNDSRRPDDLMCLGSEEREQGSSSPTTPTALGRTVRRLGLQILTGDHRVAPRDDACNACGFAALCRVESASGIAATAHS